MKTIERVIDSLLGAIGGIVFSILSCMTIFTTLRISNAHFPNAWALYLGLLIAGPIMGIRCYNFFGHFFASLFNLFSTEGSGGGGAHLGPDNVDNKRDWLFQTVYLIAIILLFIATVFSALTPLILSFILLAIYSAHAMRLSKKSKPAAQQGGAGYPPQSVGSPDP